MLLFTPFLKKIYKNLLFSWKIIFQIRISNVPNKKKLQKKKQRIAVVVMYNDEKLPPSGIIPVFRAWLLSHLNVLTDNSYIQWWNWSSFRIKIPRTSFAMWSVFLLKVRLIFKKKIFLIITLKIFFFFFQRNLLFFCEF